MNIHVWDAAGIGVAPYHVVGIAEIPSASLAEANPSAYNAALRAIPNGYQVGRRNSKTYNAEYERIEDIFYSL